MSFTHTLTHDWQQPLPVLRRRLAMQGFTGVPDADLPAMALWLRFSPAVCLVGVTIGTMLTSPVIIGVLLAMSLVGAVVSYAVPDLLYNYLIQPRTKGPRLPRRRAPSRFACWVATFWLTAILIAFVTGYNTIGYVLGVAMAVVAALMTFGHYCVASHLWRKLFGWPATERA